MLPRIYMSKVFFRVYKAYPALIKSRDGIELSNNNRIYLKYELKWTIKDYDGNS